jgi:integrase
VSATDYLIKRHQTWYVRVQVPKQLWVTAGTRAFVKTLKTRDLLEANRLKHAHIAEFNRQIKALKEVRNDPLRAARLKALEWRDAIEKAKGEVIGPEGQEEDMADFLRSEALDELRDLERTIGPEYAAQLARMVKSTSPPLAEHYESWLDQQAEDITKQTARQHRAAVRDFLRWAGEDICIGDVSRKLAGEYVNTLLSPDSGLKRRTVARRITSLSSLWGWLEDRGHAAADSNPWLRQLRGKRGRRGQEKTRSPWKDEQLVKLLTGEMTPQYTATLHDLVRLALVTGARLDELCSLKTTDAQKRKDGWWLVVSEGKTQAAVREVPVHESGAHVLENRQTTSDGFVFPGLVPGGPDGKRSWNVVKAFVRYRDKLEFERDLTFHSLRKTFIEVMEGQEVPETTVKLLVGHKRPSLTFGGYSTGERVKLRESIDKLKYSGAVMKAIRRKEPTPSKRAAKSKHGEASPGEMKGRRSG